MPGATPVAPPVRAHRLDKLCLSIKPSSPPLSPLSSPRSPPCSYDALGSPCGEGLYVGGRNKEGKKHGRGTYTYSSGSVFEGTYHNGLREGRGMYTYFNGNRYEGEYVANAKSGLGTYYFADTGERYVGQWRADKMHGLGTYYYASGDVYEGAYENGEKRGKGVLIYRNKDGVLMRRPLDFPDPKHSFPKFR